MKNFIKLFLRSMRLYVKSMESIHFGVEWGEDIKCLLAGQELEIVMDVGANIGQTAYEVMKHFPKSHVYCFEPIPSTFNELVERTKIFPNVFPINIAFGDEIETLSIMAKPLSEQNTLVANTEEIVTENMELIEVKVETLDQFCEKNKISKINLLKIDTEGYEMKVLKGAENLITSGCIDYILIECEFLKRTTEPHGNFIEIMEHLQSFQYNVVAFYTGGIDNLGWKWGDVLFRKISDKKPNKLLISPFLSR
jgi:FkbM family methyltransferase